MLEENNNTGKFLYIYDGKLTMKAKEGEAKAVERKNKNNEMIWEKYFFSISGKITNLAITTGKFGNQLNISIVDGETYILTLLCDSGYFSNFINKLDHIDVKKEIKISPYSLVDSKSGKKRIGISLYQDNKKIEYFITKDKKPGGYPLWKDGFSEAQMKSFFLYRTEWEIKYFKSKNFGFENVIEKKNIETNDNIEFQDFDDPGGAFEDEVPFDPSQIK